MFYPSKLHFKLIILSSAMIYIRLNILANIHFSSSLTQWLFKSKIDSTTVLGKPLCPMIVRPKRKWKWLKFRFLSYE